MTMQFSDLPLQPQLLQAITEQGYTEPTPIQSGVIQMVLDGHDVIGQAQTGTGKTAAFSLPLIQNVVPNQKHVQALVIAPTRELALQVSKSITEYGKYHGEYGVRVITVYGGTAYSQQTRPLKRGVVDVVVGTPGRMIDLIKKDYLDLSMVNTVVMDEADEMLSMGFVEDIETILAALPEKHQTCLFSATMPKPIRKLADKYMTNPQTVTIAAKQLTVEAIEQRYYMVNGRDKTAATAMLFETEGAEMESVLIFTRTRASTSILANELTQRGFSAEALSGDLSQDARQRVLKRFTEGKIKVLVATDVAARGLDINTISHVFNYDVPEFAEVYVHRVGRTGRAGRKGTAITFLSPRDRHHLRKIERYTKQKLPQATLPTYDEILKVREERVMTDFKVWLNRGRCKAEKVIIEQLIEEGHEPIELAAIALKMARAEEKKRPIPKLGEPRSDNRDYKDNRGGRGRGRNDRGGRKGGRDNDRRSDRSGGGERRRSSGGDGRKSKEDGMVRMMINVGKSEGVRPGDVVGTIAHHADIPGRSLGAIRIQDGKTYVDVPDNLVGKVLAKKGNYQIHSKDIDITIA